MKFRRATDLAHSLIRERIRSRDRVIDATVGNGHDTLFLAELVGPDGHVTGFDLQQEAIESATARLERAGMLERVTLHHCGHETMADVLAGSEGGNRAVMFNLGYLPGGDKSVITLPESTVSALEASLDLLMPGGLITVVIYPGHDGGSEEAGAVERFVAGLDPERFDAVRHRSLNQAGDSPFLIAIERAET